MDLVLRTAAAAADDDPSLDDDDSDRSNSDGPVCRFFRRFLPSDWHRRAGTGQDREKRGCAATVAEGSAGEGKKHQT